MASNNKDVKNIKNIISWFDPTSAVVILISIGLLFKGLYFEETHLVMTSIIFTICLFVSLRAFFTKDIDCGINTATILSGLFSAVYMSTLLNPASMRDGLLIFVKYLGVFSLVLMIYFLGNNEKTRCNTIKYSYFIGTFWVLIGLDGIFGGRVIKIINMVSSFFSSPGELPFLSNMVLGDRLASVFQYPNTASSFFLAIWLLGISLTISNEYKRGRCVQFLLPMVGLAYILTLSRGGYLLALPTLILAALVLPNPKGFLLQWAYSLVPVLFLSWLFWPAGTGRSLGLLGWIFVLMICALYTFLMEKYFCASIKKMDDGKIHFHPASAFVKKAMSWMGLFILLASVLVIFWMGPVTLKPSETYSMTKAFSLTETGDYELELQFDAPPKGDLSVIIEGFSFQDNAIREGQRFLEAELSATGATNSEVIKLPFAYKDDQILWNKMKLQGQSSEEVKLEMIRILDAKDGQEVKELPLKRKLLPLGMSQRIDQLLQLDTAMFRLAFYLDGLKVLKDAPFTGVGGGGWIHVYGQYQSYLYAANDIHSFGVQLLVEAGLLGLLLLMLLLGFMFVQFIHIRKMKDLNSAVLWLAAAALLGHSMIDIDFSYYALFLLFWFWLGILEDPFEERLRVYFKKQRKKFWKYWIIAPAIIGLFFSGRFILANQQMHLYNQSAMARQADKAVSHMEKAIALDPWRTENHAILAKLIVQQGKIEESQQLIDEATEKGWHTYLTLGHISEYYQRTYQWEEAYRIERRICELRPMDPVEWERQGQMIQKALQWHLEEENSGETSEAQIQVWLDRGLALRDEMTALSKDRWADIEMTPVLAELEQAWLNMKDNR